MSNREKFLASTDGTKLWAESAGDPSKPALVFIHGLACTALVFESQFTDPELLQNLHLVRYEMRGHGRSGMPDDPKAYDSLRHAEDFHTVCEVFKLQKPFVLGWSLGGCIPVDIVGAYGTDFISGVIYVGGPVLSLRLNEECFTPDFRALIPLMLSEDASVTGKTAAAFIDSCVLNPSAIPYATKLLWMGGYCSQPPQMRRFALSRQQDDTRWLAEARKLPALIVQGTEDSHCLYERMLEQARGVYDDLDVQVMQGIGHAPHYERHEETNRCILAFVKGALKAFICSLHSPLGLPRRACTGTAIRNIFASHLIVNPDAISGAPTLSDTILFFRSENLPSCKFFTHS